MNTVSENDFATKVMSLVNPEEPFKPVATYDRDGDCIEFLMRPDAFYAERVDDLVTVYYSQDTKEVIGSLIKGVSGFCANVLKKLPGFRIDIIDGRVKLVHIFRAKLWSSERDPVAGKTVTYRKLIEAAEESELDVEAESCVS
ncbi:MAG: hypothetical protein E6G97_18365 [Alphaproteobacteria bacterium]|nr:MAG: hypothetical protein E6G97_18365 [Alphaproteobacteria bacterium]